MGIPLERDRGAYHEAIGETLTGFGGERQRVPGLVCRDDRCEQDESGDGLEPSHGVLHGASTRPRADRDLSRPAFEVS